MLYKKIVGGSRVAVSELLRSGTALFCGISGGRGQAVVVTDRPLEGAWPLPQAPAEFFREMAALGEFAWRELPDGTIEIAVDPAAVGWWIGREGHKVRAIQEHLGRKVRIIPGIRVSCSPWVPSEARPHAFKLIFAKPTGTCTGAVFAPWVWPTVAHLFPRANVSRA